MDIYVKAKYNELELLSDIINDALKQRMERIS